MNVIYAIAIAIGTQGCSGAVVVYLLPNLKLEGSHPPCAPLHRRKIPVAQKTQQKIQAHMPKTFFALCTNIVYDIRSGYRKLTSSLVTVGF
jgi:hypothetical protein